MSSSAAKDAAKTKSGSSAGHSAGGTPKSRRAAPQAAGVPASAAAVIEGWTDALREGHAQLAASYWAHPSVMVNGLDAAGQLTLIHIRTAHEAQLADETLSCGATLHHTSLIGKYIHADFTLSTRSGAGASSSGCSGPASVNFLIRDGHIVRWLRASTTPTPGPSPGGKSTGAGAGREFV